MHSRIQYQPERGASDSGKVLSYTFFMMKLDAFASA